MLKAVAVSLTIAALASPARALAPPDPATIELPDLSPPADREEGSKHYYFHKAGVAYEEAYSDFADCYRYFPVAGADASLPMFAPWRRKAGVEKLAPAYNYGLVGIGIAALLAPSLERKAKSSRLRRCLETRGYLRYPIAEKSARQIIDDYSERSIALQARAA